MRVSINTHYELPSIEADSVQQAKAQVDDLFAEMNIHNIWTPNIQNFTGNLAQLHLEYNGVVTGTVIEVQETLVG